MLFPEIKRLWANENEVAFPHHHLPSQHLPQIPTFSLSIKSRGDRLHKQLGVNEENATAPGIDTSAFNKRINTSHMLFCLS